MANGREIDRFGAPLEIDDKDLENWGGVHLLPESEYAALGVPAESLRRWPREADRAATVRKEDQPALDAFRALIDKARKQAELLEATRTNVNKDWVNDAAKAVKGGK